MGVAPVTVAVAAQTPPNAQLRPTFTFGGIWFSVPVSDDPAAARAVRNLVREHLGTADVRAADRERMRRQLLASAEQARDLGATELYIAEQVADGIPVSATLSVHAPTPRLSVAVGTGARAVMDTFMEGLERTGHAPAEAQRFTVGDSEVLRTTEVVDSESVPVLTMRFWVTVPSTKTVLPLTFVSPFAQLAQPLEILFTAVVSTLRWVPVAPVR